MKKIEAIIQPEALEKVKEALFDAEVHKMTVHRVRGCGQQRGYSESYRGKIYQVNLLEKIKLEIAVNEDFVQPTIDHLLYLCPYWIFCWRSVFFLRFSGILETIKPDDGNRGRGTAGE